MAGAYRGDGADLSWIERLLQRPGRYGLLAVADRLARSGCALRLCHDHDLSFTGAELRAARRVEADGGAAGAPTIELTATFLGATGAAGVAPLYLADLAAEPGDDGDARRDLLDVFHHRLYELLLAGLRAGDPARAAGFPGDPWAAGLAACLGATTLRLASLGAGDLLRAAPLLVGRGRGPRVVELGLRRLVGARLGAASLRLEERAGGWVRVAEGGQMRLGAAETVTLGRTTTIGAWCRDPAGLVRLHVGPLPAARIPEARPGGALHTAICEALAVLVHDVVDFELVVAVTGDPSPPIGEARVGLDLRLVAPGEASRALHFPLSPGPARESP